MNTRQFYIDWIRVIAFGLLILYHTGMFFNTWSYHLKNIDLSKSPEYIMLFLSQWRLHLLFFISGVGVSFALKLRSSKKFIWERTLRLFVPLIFGMFVIVVPQLYFERLYEEIFSGSILSFYSKVLEFKPYQDGNFSWHHLWFLLYLFTYCLICLPLFIWLRTEKGKKWNEKVVLFFAKPYRVLSLTIPLVIINYFLSYMGNSNNFISDWYNHAMSMSLYIFGYMLGNRIEFWNFIEIHRKKYLLIATTLTIMLYVLFWTPISLLQRNSTILNLTYSIMKIVNIWAIILTICGYSKHYLNKSNSFIKYATEAVLPFYILHQTIIISVGYYIANWEISSVVKFVFLVIATFSGSWLIYQYLIKPFSAIRVLFGLKVLQTFDKRIFIRSLGKSIISIIFVVGFMSLLSSFQSAKSVIEVPVSITKPVIDGNLNDSIWQKALFINKFIINGSTIDKKPTLQTEVYITSDKENLYIAFNCYNTDSAKISKTNLKRDSFKNNDWVAICLNSYNNSTEIPFFMVTPNNNQIDGQIDFVYGKPNMTRNYHWKSATQITGKDWTAEISIPFSCLQYQLKNESFMRFKVARYVKHLKQEFNYPCVYSEAQAQISQLQKIKFNSFVNQDLIVQTTKK